jgi:PST family polysaccharide transporter
MVPVLRVIALAFVLAPLSVVPRALLQRELNFRTMFLADSAGSVGYGAVGITMALLGYGYWSLVGAQLASAIFLAIALCILTGYIPPLVPTFSGIGELYGFGIGVTGVGLLTYLASQIDYFVIGRRLDAAALGLYRQAYNIVMMPVSMIARTIYPVLFPAFSALQDDLPRLRSAYGRVVATLCVIGFPALSLLSVSAPELIPVVLGEQWLEAVLPTQIMAFIGVQMLIGSPAGAAIKAVGKVYFEWWIQLARIVMLAPAVWYATRWGIAGVAWAVLGVYFLLLPLIVLFVRKGIGFGFIEMGRAVMPAVVIALCTIAGSEGVRLILLQHEVAPVIVVVSTLLAGVMVAFVIGWLWRPPGVMELVRAVGPRLRKWTGKQ